MPTTKSSAAKSSAAKPAGWSPWLSRGIAVLLVGAALIALTPRQILQLFIVAGQGHFLASYYYQYRAGRITPAYAAAYGACALALFAGLWLYPRLDLWVGGASLYFALHLLLDEAHLLGREPGLRSRLELTPALSLYAGLILERLYAWQTWPLFAGIAGAAGAAYLVRSAQEGRRLDRVSAYFAGLAALAAVSHWLPRQVDFAEHIMGATILYHYANWYSHYYVKYAADRPRRRRYVVEILAANALVLLLYAAYRARVPSLQAPGVALFAPAPFYLWTILHILFVTRAPDFAWWLGAPARAGSWRPRAAA